MPPVADAGYEYLSQRFEAAHANLKKFQWRMPECRAPPWAEGLLPYQQPAADGHTQSYGEPIAKVLAVFASLGMVVPLVVSAMVLVAVAEL